MKRRSSIPVIAVPGSGRMDSANEMQKGWIFAEGGLESVESGLVFNVNRSKEMESAAMNPVLAYQSTYAQRFEVTRRRYVIVVLIRIRTDVINDQKPKLRGEMPSNHVVRGSRSRKTVSGGEEWWCLKGNG